MGDVLALRHEIHKTGIVGLWHSAAFAGFRIHSVGMHPQEMVVDK